MNSDAKDIISPESARTLSGLFCERVRRSPQLTAYRYFDQTKNAWADVSWSDMADQVAKCQLAMIKESILPGDSVAIMLNNSCQWVMFEQAALGLECVVVPLYVNDRPENIAYILEDTGTKLLIVENEEQWRQLKPALEVLQELKRVISLKNVSGECDSTVKPLVTWLSDDESKLLTSSASPEQLATIVYTSGTVGRPKGVMLSHKNILWNAYSGQKSINIYRDDLFLSFLPLSHMLERTIGYYLPMMAGATVAYARSIPTLAEDILSQHPTVLISVPRIYERIYGRIQAQLAEKSSFARKIFSLAVSTGWRNFEHQQQRAGWHPSLWLWPFLQKRVANKIVERLGGRLRVAICGGAPLSSSVARLFLGMGVPLVQGYGLTETSPVISVNHLDNNDPASVGLPLEDVEIKLGDDDELLCRSPGVMLGYWNKPDATAGIIDADHWLHTGDIVRIDNGRIYITGRLKEIIVMSNGEKVPPADMEMAIEMDPLFEQVMIVGEGRPYLAAIIVLEKTQWEKTAQKWGLDISDPLSLNDARVLEEVRNRIASLLKSFPGYAQIRRVSLTLEPWSVDNGLQTPTLKMRRNRILEQLNEGVEKLYEGH